MNKEHLRLKEFRTSLKWNQSELVEFLNKHAGGCTRPNYSNMEKGTRPIPIDYIHVLHLKLGMSYEWFFHGKGSRKKDVQDKLTVTDIGELKSKIELLTNKLQSLSHSFKTMHADFYAHVHNS